MTDPKEICIHHYEKEGTWGVEIYNDSPATYFAKRCGMQQVASSYDGNYFKGTTVQMAYFFRFLSGESVRVPKEVKAAGGSDSGGSEAIEQSPQTSEVSGRQKRKRRTRRNVQKEA